MTATEAQRAGLVTYVVDDTELDATVDQVVEDLAALPQPAVRMTKMVLNRWLKESSERIRGEALALEAVSSQLPDHQEAIEAFLNDRRPEFPTGTTPDG